jgi:hypothetical protein
MPPQNGGGFASGIRVAGLDFTRQDHTGARVSSLVGSGSLDYPDYHGVKGATFQAPDTLDLVPTRELRIEEFALASDGKGLRLRLDGIAGRAATGSTDFTRDHRLSVFEHLWHGRRAVVMFGSGTFVVAFTLLAYHVHRGSGRTPR